MEIGGSHKGHHVYLDCQFYVTQNGSAQGKRRRQEIVTGFFLVTVNRVAKAYLDSGHLFSDWPQKAEGVTTGKRKKLTPCFHWKSGQCVLSTSVKSGSSVRGELLISNCCSGTTVQDREDLWEVRTLSATGSGSQSAVLGKVPEGSGMTLSPVA